MSPLGAMALLGLVVVVAALVAIVRAERRK